jgi:hypothetical protein
LKGNCRGLIEVPFRNCPGGTEENHENPQSEEPVFQTRFERSNSRMQVLMSPLDQSARISLSMEVLIVNNTDELVEFSKRKKEPFENYYIL